MHQSRPLLTWGLFIALVITIGISINLWYSNIKKDFLISQANMAGGELGISSAINATQHKYKVGHSIPVNNCDDLSKIAINQGRHGYTIHSQTLKNGTVNACNLSTSGINYVGFNVIATH